MVLSLLLEGVEASFQKEGLDVFREGKAKSFSYTTISSEGTSWAQFFLQKQIWFQSSPNERERQVMVNCSKLKSWESLWSNPFNKS